MTKVRVVIDNLLLEETVPNTIVSILYIENDDICFPSHKWIELSSSVLDMWLSTLADFFVCSKVQAVLHFMDGPYSLRITRTSENRFQLEMINIHNTIAILEAIDIMYFCRQILSVSEKMRCFAETVNNVKIQATLSEKINKLKNAFIETKQAKLEK